MSLLTSGCLRSTVLLLLLLAGSARADDAARVEATLGRLGFDGAEIARIRSGELVRVEVEGTSERELAIAMAFLVRAPRAVVRDVFLLEHRDFAYDPSISAYGVIEGDGSPRDFEALHLEPDPQGMAATYLGAAPGTKLNLSTEELERFRTLAKGDGQERARVEAELRAQLLLRHRSYRQGGLAAIAPYARAGGRVFEPGAELRRQTEHDAELEAEAPIFYRALLEYPSAPADGVTEQFLWVKYVIDDKPTFALVHRMDRAEGDGWVFAERHFYVSRSHNSVQIIGADYEVEEGLIVLYVNRTSTDQVAGFGGSAKRALGRRVMEGRIVKVFERMRAAEATTD